MKIRCYTQCKCDVLLISANMHTTKYYDFEPKVIVSDVVHLKMSFCSLRVPVKEVELVHEDVSPMLLLHKVL